MGSREVEVKMLVLDTAGLKKKHVPSNSMGIAGKIPKIVHKVYRKIQVIYILLFTRRDDITLIYRSIEIQNVLSSFFTT